SVRGRMSSKDQAERRRERRGSSKTREDEGGAMRLANCGSRRRLCAKIDKSATAYGENGEYRILAGY
ncbi:hypothetical protein, partial [Salmonella enterica]|uniref:hypothetical protein n=1 Tax=Salmonella enterica TaxID=28901 RepID=UPI001F40A59A